MFKLTLPALPGLRPRARLLLARIRRACLPLPRAPGEPEPRIGRRRTWRSAKQGPGPGRAERRAIQVIQSAVTVPGRPSQKDFKLGDPRCCCTVLDRGHQTGPPSGRRAIQAIQSADTVTVPRGIGLTEALARAGRPSQEDFKLGCPRCCCTVTAAVSPSWRDRTQSPKHWRVRAVPVRKTSSWAAPAAVAPSRYRAAATGQGYLAGRPSVVTVPGGIGLTKALARTGRPSQKDFKLGGPHCSGCCTVPDRGHRRGPSGRWAIIQSAVTVPGGIMIRLTEALARAGRRGRPSQEDFKFGCPRCCSSCTVPGRSHRTGPLGQRSNI